MKLHILVSKTQIQERVRQTWSWDLTLEASAALKLSWAIFNFITTQSYSSACWKWAENLDDWSFIYEHADRVLTNRSF